MSHIIDVKLNSLNKRVMLCNALRCHCPWNQVLKIFCWCRVCQYLEIATKEILICPTTDHQQQIVSLSEKKEKPETNNSLY